MSEYADRPVPAPSEPEPWMPPPPPPPPAPPAPASSLEPAHSPEPPPSAGAPRPPLSVAPWPISWALGLTAGMAVLMVAAGAGIGAVRRLELGEPATALLGGALLAVAYIALLGVVAFVSRRRGVSLVGAVGLRAVDPAAALGLGFTLAMSGRVLAGVWGLVVQRVGVDLPGSDLDPTQAFGDGPAGALMLVLFGVVLAPVVEEVVFRGVVLPAMERSWSTTAAVLGSSLAFSVLHLSVYAGPPIFLLAVLLSVSFIRTRSLWVPILAHAMFNGVGIGLLYLFRGFGLV